MGVNTLFKAYFLTHSTSKRTRGTTFHALPHCAGTVSSIIGKLKLEELVSIIDETIDNIPILSMMKLSYSAVPALLGSLVPGPHAARISLPV